MDKPVVKTEILGVQIKLGCNVDVLFSGLIDKHVSLISRRMMRTKDFIPVNTKGQFVRLVLRTVASLGFTHGAEYQHICLSAIKQGLDLCPAEAGPQMRKVCSNQKKGGPRIRIAMEPLSVRDARYIFLLDNNEKGLSLIADETRPDDFYESKEIFFFVFPSKRSPVLNEIFT